MNVPEILKHAAVEVPGIAENKQFITFKVPAGNKKKSWSAGAMLSHKSNQFAKKVRRADRLQNRASIKKTFSQ